MSSTIDIDIKVNGEGLSKLDDATHKVDALGKAAGDAAGGGSGTQGFNALTIAVGEFVGGVAVELAHQLPQIVEQLYKMGVESLRAKQGFEAMGGSADAIAKMQAAAHGLADDTDLMAAGTLALSAGVVKSTADLTELARIGATLGVTFKGSAKEGITAFTMALDSVGNVRALRALGVDTLAVKERFEELKKTMTDQEAWKMAVFEVAGANATKLAGNLDGAGTSLDKLSVRFEDAKEAMGEWVAEGVDKAATSLTQLETIWNALQANPNLTLSIIAQQVSEGAQKARNPGTVNPLTGKTWEEEAYGNTNTSRGFHDTQSPLPFGGDAKLPEIGSDPYAGGGWQSPWQRNHAGPPVGGDQMYWQRRNRATARDNSMMGNDALREEFVKPYEQAKDLATARGEWQQINTLAGEYHSKMMAVLAPLQAQQRLLEQRKSIQSISDAFGTQSDGLYSEIGSGMSDAIATRRERYAEQQRKKIGTYSGGYTLASADQIKSYDEKAKAERDAYERSIGDPTAQELYKGGDYKKARMEAYDKSQTGRRKRSLRKGKGKAYTKKDYENDLAQFDRESKEATDAYAIATGSATKESIKFKDQLEAAKKAYEDGKTSLTQYKNELLLLGEAAKSGTTSMDQLNQIQRRLNLDMKPGAKSEADKSLFEQYAGGVKTKGSASGAAGEKETKPFDAVVVSANEAAAASTKVGTAGAAAVGQLAIAGLLAATSMGNLHSQGDTALQTIVKLKTELNTLASLKINITSSSQGGGGSSGGRSTGRAGGVQGPPR